jgi:hypothetical protein
MVLKAPQRRHLISITPEIAVAAALNKSAPQHAQRNDSIDGLT